MEFLFCVAGYLFFLGVSVGHLVFLLNHTDFVLEYGRLLHLQRFLSLDEYGLWKQKEENCSCYFPVFIREKYKTFSGRLVGCHYCLTCFICVLLAGPLGLVSAALGSVLYGLEALIHKKINA